MRRFAVLIALAACGDNDVPSDPIDMTHRVVVEELEDTCSGGPLDGPETAFVEARLHADGTVELVEESLWIPGPGAFPSIRVHAGVVDYDATRATAYVDKVYPYRIDGTLTMEAMDLELTEHWYRQGDFSDCVRRVRMRGAARALLDASSLDGLYEIDVRYYGETCGQDPLPPDPLGRQTLLLDADPREDGMRLWLDGLLAFDPGLPAADGSVSWSGPMTVSSIEGPVATTGSYEGRFRPGEVAGDLAFRLEGQADGCAYRYRLEGARRPSTSTEPQNDYRAVFRVRDGCEGRVETVETRVTLVRQADGVMEVRDRFGAWYIGFDGTTLHAEDGDEYVTAEFSGTADPPYLSYTVSFTYGQGDDACTYAWDVDAVVRHHPDIPWEPAFRPDPTRTAPDLE